MNVLNISTYTVSVGATWLVLPWLLHGHTQLYVEDKTDSSAMSGFFLVTYVTHTYSVFIQRFYATVIQYYESGLRGGLRFFFFLPQNDLRTSWNNNLII